jgi:hypothetical protein
MMLIASLVVAVIAVVVAGQFRLPGRTRGDLGWMSEQWLAQSRDGSIRTPMATRITHA